MTTPSVSDPALDYIPDVVLVAKQNDRFRRGVCANPPGLAPSSPDALRGRVVFTRAVAAKGLLFKLRCLAAIAAHDTFEPENDPDRLRDFGCVRVDGERVWFKVDLYSDETFSWGSERMDDPAATVRLMTVMFPSDW